MSKQDRFGGEDLGNKKKKLIQEWVTAREQFSTGANGLAGLVSMKKQADESHLTLEDLGGTPMEFMSMCRQFAAASYKDIKYIAQEETLVSYLGQLASFKENIAYVGLSLADIAIADAEFSDVQRILAVREIVHLKQRIMDARNPDSQPLLTVSIVADQFHRGNISMEEYGFGAREALTLMYEWALNYIQYMATVANSENLMAAIGAKEITALQFAFQNVAVATKAYEDAFEGFQRNRFESPDDVVRYFKNAGGSRA